MNEKEQSATMKSKVHIERRPRSWNEFWDKAISESAKRGDLIAQKILMLFAIARVAKKQKKSASPKRDNCRK